MLRRVASLARDKVDRARWFDHKMKRASRERDAPASLVGPMYLDRSAKETAFAIYGGERADWLREHVAPQRDPKVGDIFTSRDREGGFRAFLLLEPCDDAWLAAYVVPTESLLYLREDGSHGLGRGWRGLYERTCGPLSVYTGPAHTEHHVGVPRDIRVGTISAEALDAIKSRIGP